MVPLLRVGVISSSHGVRGEVKVYPTTDDISRFKLLKTCLLETERGNMTLNVENVSFSKGMAIIKFREFNSIEDMMPYKGHDLLITRDQAVPLREGEYYIADLIGLEVYSDEGGHLGRLSEVMQTGANDVYVVERPGNKELLIPVIKDCVKKVDIEGGRLTVHILPGLSDL